MTTVALKLPKETYERLVKIVDKYETRRQKSAEYGSKKCSEKREKLNEELSKAGLDKLVKPKRNRSPYKDRLVLQNYLVE